MLDFYRYNYSTSHLFFPKIVITILVVLGLCILVPKVVRAIRSGQPILQGGKHFFVENYDKLKLFGSVGLLVAYIIALELIGFIPASLVFIFAFNVLFCGTLKPKSLLISAITTVVSVIGIWYVFGVLFNITLP